MAPDNTKALFDFFHRAGNLKFTYRFDQIKNMPKESSAAHSWRFALMTFMIADELKLDINVEHAMKIALAHDLAEVNVGNTDHVLVAQGKISAADKKNMEKTAMLKLKSGLPPERGEEIYALWEEFENGTSAEAKYARALAKIETLTFLIEAGYQTYDYPEFIANYADETVKEFPALKGMLKQVKQELKAEFEKGNIPWKEEYGSID